MPAGNRQEPLSGVSSSSVEEIKPILHTRKNMRDGDSGSEGFAPIKKKSKRTFSSAGEESNEGSADDSDEEDVGAYRSSDDSEDGGHVGTLVELLGAKAMLKRSGNKRAIVKEATATLTATALAYAGIGAKEFAESEKPVNEMIAKHGPKWVEDARVRKQQSIDIAKMCLEEVANIRKEIVRNPELGSFLQGGYSSIAEIVKAVHDDDASQAMSDAISAANSAKDLQTRREQASAADNKSFAEIDGLEEVAGKPSNGNAISDSKMRDA